MKYSRLNKPLVYYNPAVKETFYDWVVEYDPDYPGDPDDLADHFNWLVVPLVTQTFQNKVRDFELQRDKTSQLAVLAMLIDQWYETTDNILANIAIILSEAIEETPVDYNTKLEFHVPEKNLVHLTHQKLLRSNYDYLRTHRQSHLIRDVRPITHRKGVQTLQGLRDLGLKLRDERK